MERAVNAIVWAVRSLPFASVLICLAMSDGISGMVMLLVCLGTTIGWRVRSTPRFEIALNTVLLTAAWSSVWGLYSRWSSWDLVIHFVLTAVLAVLALRSLDTWVLTMRHDRTRTAIATVLLGCILSCVWEVLELLGHSYIAHDIEVGPRDTLGDVLAGMTGAMVVSLWQWRIATHREQVP